MTNIIELNNLHKHFNPDPALNGVNFTLKEHSVMGLLGVNGAGKTTLMRCALGLLKPSLGEATIYGETAWDMSPQIKMKVGYVAQTLDYLPWMTAEQLLEFTSTFYPNWDAQYVNQLMRRWDLPGSKKISNMSEGQKQRLGIVQGMGHHPDLLILDEPAASLDPVARRDFIKQLIDLNVEEGKTILFSTHIVSDIERVAAEVAILKSGSVCFQGELDSLKETFFRLNLRASNPLPERLDIEGLQSIQNFGHNASAVVCQAEEKFTELKTRLQHQLKSVEVEKIPLNLEEIFLEINR